MFDDPKKALAQLEEELLAVEKTDDDFERFYSELYKEFGQKDEKAEEELEDLLSDVPVRRIPGPYDKSPDRSAYADHHRNAAPARKEKGVAGLVVLICLECLGIVGIAAWWIMRLI